MLDEHDETVGGNCHVETALVRGDSSAAITYVLPTVNGGVAIEDFLPPAVRNSQQIFLNYVTVSEGTVVETRNDNNFLVSAPPLEGNDSIGVPLVKDVNIVATDRPQSAAETDEILIKAKE